VTFTLQGNLYTGNYRNVFTNDSILFNENAEVTLLPWDYVVYEIGSGITGIERNETLLREYNLNQNYPNPFNPSTKIGFNIPEQGVVSLKVFNLLGEEVKTLLTRELKKGTYNIDFNDANYSSGIYFYSIRVNNYIATKKMVLMK
jgi:hypothetical protein